MCTTEVVPFIQQGSVEGSGLPQEASAKYGIPLVSVLCTSFSVEMHDAKGVIFICQIITCVVAKPWRLFALAMISSWLEFIRAGIVDSHKNNEFDDTTVSKVKIMLTFSKKSFYFLNKICIYKHEDKMTIQENPL